MCISHWCEVEPPQIDLIRRSANGKSGFPDEMSVGEFHAIEDIGLGQSSVSGFPEYQVRDIR